MNQKFRNGVYPVMLTPFTEDNQVDYESLGRLVDWYIENGAAGLFAVCQSSEMFFLSEKESAAITKFVVSRSAKRIPVISSGHVSDSLTEQAQELMNIANAGADAVILLTNRLAKEDESDEVWLENLKILLDKLPKNLPLGFYECPYPYKRLISPELLKWCADTGRFYFIKDTSCDLENIKAKIEAVNGSRIKLFNANSATLKESLELGACGYSGVMANFHPQLYAWIVDNYGKETIKAGKLSDFLTISSMIECRVYPVNAKYHQKMIGNFASIHTRTKNAELLNAVGMSEVEQLNRLTAIITEYLDINR